MTPALLFNQQESATLVENFFNQDFNQFSCVIIRKVLQTKTYHDDEPLVVHALMEVMGNVLDKFKQVEADKEGIMQLSNALYDLLLRVECVEAD